MEYFKHPLFHLRSGVNSSLAGKEPWQIVFLTTCSVLTIVWIDKVLNDDETLIQRGKKTFFKLLRLIPSIRKKIDDELEVMAKNFEDDVKERTKNLNYITTLPEQSLSKEEIIQIVNGNLNLGEYDWKNGRVSGAVYCYDPKLIELITEIYGKTSYTNPLHPDLFPGLCKMEAEVVRMAANLFHGDDGTCGTMTSGGTESILMACKAYRDYARKYRNIKRPQIIVPVTAHSAFDKAGLYLGLRVRTIKIDPMTAKVDIKAMEKAITCNTVMLVGSAPNFPYGTMDDIDLISDLGLKYNIPVHVDSCLGGFLTVFMEDAGYPVPLCDFRLPGVTSISADTHKYGYSPKGSSIILYRNTKYRQCQYTVTTDWPGGVYGSPTVSGSRAGGNIAVCWASMLSFGKKGYIESTRNIIHTTKYIEKGLRRIKGISLFGQPATSVIAMGSNDFDIYRLSSALNKLGWNLNALQFPSGIHICVTSMHTQPGVADKFLKDVQDCVAEIMKEPNIPVEGKMAIYGLAQNLPDRTIVSDFVGLYLDSLYYTRKE